MSTPEEPAAPAWSFPTPAPDDEPLDLGQGATLGESTPYALTGRSMSDALRVLARRRR